MKTLSQYKDDLIKYNLSVPTVNISIAISYANGCGASGSWFRPPKTIWGVDIESACITHDIEWQLAKCYNDLIIANLNFKSNLIKIVKKESNAVTYLLRRARVATYFLSVKLIGTDDYAEERGFEKTRMVSR